MVWGGTVAGACKSDCARAEGAVQLEEVLASSSDEAESERDAVSAVAALSSSGTTKAGRAWGGYLRGSA